jgi:hypothetical protein
MPNRLSTIVLGVIFSLTALVDAGAATTAVHAASSLRNAKPASPKTVPRDAASGMVLYRQTGTYTGAAVAQTSTDGNNASGADDFTVTDANGWTISAFNFAVVLPNYSPSAGLSYNVDVYPDASGHPAFPGVCSAHFAAGIVDNDNTMLSVPLPQACVLPQGSYWVALQANNNNDSSQPLVPQVDWSGYTAAVIPGWPASWENPGNGYGTGCDVWTPATGCNYSIDSLGFDVIGFPGGGNGSALTMNLTLAIDNGDDDQCGTATHLAVNAGDRINLCYTVINHTGVALDYQTLGDTLGGTQFSLRHQPLADGASFQYNRVISAEIANAAVIQATVSAQDRLPGFDFDDTGTSQFVDITATGTQVDLGNDNTLEVDMPFSLDFYGTTTNVLGVATNGGLTVGLIRPLFNNNEALPSGNLLAPSILPLWDDFETVTQGGIYTATTGAAPNRKFIVEWSNLVHYDSAQNTDSATFEVIFDEATGHFSFEYADVDYTATGSSDAPICNGGLCATIGVQQDAGFSTPYSFNTAAVTNGTSIDWFPGVVQNTFVTTAAASLDVGAPVVTVAPGVLTAVANTGDSVRQPLTIGNVGNRDLHWSIDSAATDIANAQAHFPRSSYRAPATSATRLAQFVAAARSSSAEPTSSPKPSGVTRSTAPLVGANIPAFAIGGEGPGGGQHPAYELFWSLDATYPFTSMLPLSSAMPILRFWGGGAFANNDFSKEYVIDRGANLFTFDTTTGMDTYVGGIQQAGVAMSDLAWDPTTQVMYATGWEFDDPTISHLYSLDLASGTLTPIATINGLLVTAATFDATGHLYAVDFTGSQLAAVDKRNGAWSAIGPIGFDVSSSGGLDIDPRTGVLWYATHPYVQPGVDNTPAMYALNPVTGHASEVGPVFDSVDLLAFALAIPYEGCSAPADVPWLSLATTDGVLNAGQLTGVDVTLDASGLGAGRYEANLCVRSDDLTNRIVGVPVTFTVTSPDAIFDNGFDSP